MITKEQKKRINEELDKLDFQAIYDEINTEKWWIIDRIDHEDKNEAELSDYVENLIIKGLKAY